MLNTKKRMTVIALAALMLSGCGNTEEVIESVKLDVEATYPVVKEISQSGSFIGTIESESKVSVTPRIAGVVTSKNYKVGDHVNAGDVLFTLDNREYEIEKKNAVANVLTAKASLDAQKARNEETKAAAAESVGTLETKKMELDNASRSSAREANEAALKIEGYNRDSNIYKSEEERLKDLQDDADKRLSDAKNSKNALSNLSEVYQRIISSDDPVETAKQLGVEEKDLEGNTEPENVGKIYLRTQTQYESIEQIQTAMESYSEAIRTAENEIKELDGSINTNKVSKVESELNAQIESTNVSNAQKAKELADRQKQDYEKYSKAQIMADAQAKIAEGDAAVVSSNSQLVNAQTELETAKLKLEYSTIKAPISGIIQEINVEQYGMVSDQSPAYVIYDPENKKAVFYVTEDVKNNLLTGQKIQIDKNDTTYESVISNISDSVDEQKKLYRIEAQLKDKAQAELSTGSTVKLTVGIKTENKAVTVPISAVYYSEGKPYVYTAVNGKAVKKDIETGINNDKDIQVVSGIEKDDQIIVSWTAQLKDQAEINVKNELQKAQKADENKEQKVAQRAEEKSEQGNNKQPEAEKKVETTDNVNIRKGPDVASDKIKTVPVGTLLVKAGEEDGWTKVIVEGKEAFIKSDYVRECAQ